MLTKRWCWTCSTVLLLLFLLATAVTGQGYETYGGGGVDAVASNVSVAASSNDAAVKAPVAPIEPPRLNMADAQIISEGVSAALENTVVADVSAASVPAGGSGPSLGYRPPPPPTRREMESHGQCAHDESKWLQEPQSAISQAIMFDRTTGISCEECLLKCEKDYQDHSVPWICRSVTYDFTWKICDLFAINGTDYPFFLIEFDGRDYFSYLAALPPTDDQLGVSQQEHLPGAPIGASSVSGSASTSAPSSSIAKEASSSVFSSESNSHSSEETNAPPADDASLSTVSVKLPQQHSEPSLQQTVESSLSSHEPDGGKSAEASQQSAKSYAAKTLIRNGDELMEATAAESNGDGVSPFPVSSQEPVHVELDANTNSNVVAKEVVPFNGLETVDSDHHRHSSAGSSSATKSAATHATEYSGRLESVVDASTNNGTLAVAEAEQLLQQQEDPSSPASEAARLKPKIQPLKITKTSKYGSAGGGVGFNDTPKFTADNPDPLLIHRTLNIHTITKYGSDGGDEGEGSGNETVVKAESRTIFTANSFIQQEESSVSSSSAASAAAQATASASEAGGASSSSATADAAAVNASRNSGKIELDSSSGADVGSASLSSSSSSSCMSDDEEKHFIQFDGYYRDDHNASDTSATNASKHFAAATSPDECMKACDSQRLLACTSAQFSARDGCQLYSAPANLRDPDALRSAVATEDASALYLERICIPAKLTQRIFPIFVDVDCLEEASCLGESHMGARCLYIHIHRTSIAIPNHILVGHVQEVTDSPSLAHCHAVCLRAEDDFGFKCKSAMWYPADHDQNCLLNAENRHTQPEVFVTEDPGVLMFYIETVAEEKSKSDRVDVLTHLTRFRDAPLKASPTAVAKKKFAAVSNSKWTRWSSCRADVGAGKTAMRVRYAKCVEHKDIRKCAKETIMCRTLAPLHIERLLSPNITDGNLVSLISTTPATVLASSPTTTTTDKFQEAVVGVCRVVRDAIGRKHCPYGMRLRADGRREFCKKPVDC